jgi:hypothetical protein
MRTFTKLIIGLLLLNWTCRLSLADAAASPAVAIKADLRQALAELRNTQPTGLLVLQAIYGHPNSMIDVTDQVRKLAWGDSLTVPVDALGNSAQGQHNAVTIVYATAGDDTIAQIDKPDGSVVQIGRQLTAIKSISGAIIAVQSKVVELRKTYPTGLLILDARFGANAKWADVTAKVQGMVKGNNLSVPATTATFGDPIFGTVKQMMITGYDGQNTFSITGGENSTLTYAAPDPDAAAKALAAAKADADAKTEAAARDEAAKAVAAKEEGVKLAQRVEMLRRTNGDGLIIVTASYGADTRWSDVLPQVQAAVVDGSVDVVAGAGWADVAPGTVKSLKVTYWDGEKLTTSVAAEGAHLTLHGITPDALKNLQPLPAECIVGVAISHAFGGGGTYKLLDGPAGVSLSMLGNFSWTPSAAQLGPQAFHIQFTVGTTTYYYVGQTEIVPKELADAVGANSANLASMLRLDLGTEDGLYFPGLNYESGLVLQKDHLIRVNADGTSIREHWDLATPYSQIFERPQYFVALNKSPGSIELLDKTTLKVIKKIKLPFPQIFDMGA